jgi:hypothetical protein
LFAGASVLSAEEAAANVRSAVSSGGNEKVAGARKAVILFSGIDSLRTKAMEDSLTLELMTAGVEVSSRPRVETLIAQKLTEAAPTAPPAGGTEPETKPQAAPRTVEPIGAVQVAKAAGAQIVLIGTMIDERQRSVLATSPPPAPGSARPGQLLEQPLVVVTATVQVVDVDTDALLMTIVGYWPNGASIPEAAAALAKQLRP